MGRPAREYSPLGAGRLPTTSLHPAKRPPSSSSWRGVAQRSGLAYLAGVAGVALDCAAALGRRGAARVATTYSNEAPSRDELDAMWRGARGALAASQVRDGLYLGWRFGPEGGMEPDGNPYGFVTARDAGHLVGVVALRRPKAVSDPRLRGTRVAA